MTTQNILYKTPTELIGVKLFRVLHSRTNFLNENQIYTSKCIENKIKKLSGFSRVILNVEIKIEVLDENQYPEYFV